LLNATFFSATASVKSGVINWLCCNWKMNEICNSWPWLYDRICVVI